jgi:hypothetical protein
VIRFIHIKKNGGTSVYKFLGKNSIKVMCGDTSNFEKVTNQHKSALHYLKEDSWKFCVCRNPYTRIVSFYNWIRRMKKYNFTFSEFVKTGFNDGRAKGAWNLQTEYILDGDGNCIVDKIFRFENLENEIKTHFNVTAKFPHLTKSTSDDYDSYYTDELKAIVQMRLKKDFEYFKYEI